MDSTNDSITVGVRCLGDRDIPRYQTPGAAAFDLAAAADLVVAPGQLALVPTGLVFAVPDGHFLAIVARSSLPKRGLIVANGLGVLDSDYRGPGRRGPGPGAQLHRRARRHRQGRPHRPGIRAARCRRVAFVPLAHDDGEGSRGGFGSTGT